MPKSDLFIPQLTLRKIILKFLYKHVYKKKGNIIQLNIIKLFRNQKSSKLKTLRYFYRKAFYPYDNALRTTQRFII